jgi:hypothetical protein
VALKLLLCPECGDCFKLGGKQQTCTCGRCSGAYRADGLAADVYGAEAVVIGIDNVALARVIDLHFDRYPEDNLSIAAWIMSEPARNVEYHRD